MTKKKQFKTWDQYVSEAEREPFELPVSEKETLVIPDMSGAARIAAGKAFRNDDPEAFFYAVGGDVAERLVELLKAAPGDVMGNLMTDLLVHFEITEEYELVGPGGGNVSERDPRKITALRKKGWRFVGEADASRG